MRRWIKLTLDLAMIAFALLAALFIRGNLSFEDDRLGFHIPLLIATLLLVVPIWRVLGIDKGIWRYCTGTDHLRLGVGMALAILAAMLVTFVYNRLEGVSRSVPVIQFLIAMAAMVFARVCVKLSLAAGNAPRPFAAIGGRQPQSVLLIGLSTLSELYVKAVGEYSDGHVRVAGIVDYSGNVDGMRVQQLPVFGGSKGIQTVINEFAVHGIFIDRLVVTTPASKLSLEGRRDLERFTASSPLPVEFFADNIGIVNWTGAEAVPSESSTATAGKEQAFRFSSERLSEMSSRYYWQLKRAIDFTAALIMVALLWPVALVVAVVTALDVGLPVIFWQVRPGLGGRPFKVYKFRTMSAARDRDGRLRTDAERLSGIGRFLRATRLDELPQLWNILIGDMSFIGPRPLLPVDQSPAYAARLLVRPGLTGWGQIKGGRNIPPDDKAALDVWYVENASLALDFEIIKGTLPMVLHGEHVDREAIDRAWRELRSSGICGPA